MSNPTYTARPPETLGSDALAELALDLRWSFNHATDAIWERLDAELWHRTHNPWLLLQTVSQAQLDAVKADADFQRLLDAVIREQRQGKRHRAGSSGPRRPAIPRGRLLQHGVHAERSPSHL